MTDGDMIRGAIVCVLGGVLFVVGASVINTIWWAGVLFVIAAMGCMGFGVFITALSNDPFPIRGY